MSESMQNANSYNCCTDNRAPDWSQFDALETGGCTSETDPKTGREFVNGGIPDDQAEFWTVYGRLKCGGAEAITDCKSRADVDAIAARLAAISGLPIN